MRSSVAGTVVWSHILALGVIKLKESGRGHDPGTLPSHPDGQFVSTGVRSDKPLWKKP